MFGRGFDSRRLHRNGTFDNMVEGSVFIITETHLSVDKHYNYSIEPYLPDINQSK